MLGEQHQEEPARRVLLAEERPHVECDLARLAVNGHGEIADLHVDALARGAIERGSELNPQLGPDQPEQIARELAAADLQVLPRALGHVHDLVVLGDHDRRRRVLLEQAEVKFGVREPVGDARLRAADSTAAPADVE